MRFSATWTAGHSKGRGPPNKVLKQGQNPKVAHCAVKKYMPVLLNNLLVGTSSAAHNGQNGVLLAAMVDMVVLAISTRDAAAGPPNALLAGSNTVRQWASVPAH